MADKPLSDRLAGAAARAQRVLGLPLTCFREDDAEALDALIAALVERMVAAGDSRADADQRAHERELEVLRRRCTGAASALEDARSAVERLGQMTSPSEMLAAAGGELCHSSDFARVVVSAICDGTMLAETVDFRDDPSGARETLEALRANPVRLEHPIVESELLRRRRATIVTDAQRDPRVDRPTAAIMGWESYVAAPIGARSAIIGVIHAAPGPGRTVRPEHRDVLWEFASGLADVYERATLRRTLRQERARMRGLLDRLNARSSQLSDAPLELVPTRSTAEPPPELLERAATTSDDLAQRPGVADVLTRREAEILRLMAEGKTNRAIAAELVISPGTVKFHVNGILRKLRAANRAEAVSRYFALRGARRRGVSSTS